MSLKTHLGKPSLKKNLCSLGVDPPPPLLFSEKVNNFLAPTGALGVTFSVRPSVCLSVHPSVCDKVFSLHGSGSNRQVISQESVSSQ